MTAFEEDWLSLRESSDHRSRDTGLLVHLNEHLERSTSGGVSTLTTRVVDLGTGTGSNLRYLLPRLGRSQHWQLVDNDPKLLDVIPDKMQRWATPQHLKVDVKASQLVLQDDDAQWVLDVHTLDLATDLPKVQTVDLMTASALLDLFSADRIEAIATLAQQHRAACLFALNYDGRLRCTPEHQDDHLIFSLFNDHQNRDKGLGAALGPEGGAAMAQALRDAHYSVIVSRTDWQLDNSTAQLCMQLMDGWCAATTEQSPDHAARIAAWRRDRQHALDAGMLRISVGHNDVLGLPPESP